MRQHLFISIVLIFLRASFAAEAIYHPAGRNSASIAAPRDDWYADVQRKFDRYSGKHFDIVFDGDSIMNRWEITGREIWSKHYAGEAADFGIEGDRVENVLWRLDDGKRVTYIDLGPKIIEPDGTISPEMMPDFVHPTLKGYQIWADAMQPIIDQYAGAKPPAKPDK